MIWKLLLFISVLSFKKKYKKVYREKIYRIHNLGEISWTEALVGYEETYPRGRTHSPLEDTLYNTHTHTHISSPAEPQPGHCSQFKKEASHLVGKFSHTNTLGKKYEGDTTEGLFSSILLVNGGLFH